MSFSAFLFNPGRSRKFLRGLHPDVPASTASSQSLTIAPKQDTVTGACCLNQVHSAGYTCVLGESYRNRSSVNGHIQITVMQVLVACVLCSLCESLTSL